MLTSRLPRRDCIVCRTVYRPTGPAQKYCKKCGDAIRRERGRQNSYRHAVKVGRIRRPGVGSGGHQDSHHNPCWKGGCPAWQAKKYRKTSCEHCGSTRHLCLHHRNEDRRDRRKSNLITLCRSCHSRVHRLHKNFEKTGKKFENKRRQ